MWSYNLAEGYDGAQYVDELHHLYEKSEAQRSRLEEEVLVMREQLAQADGKVVTTSEHVTVYEKQVIVGILFPRM